MVKKFPEDYLSDKERDDYARLNRGGTPPKDRATAELVQALRLLPSDVFTDVIRGSVAMRGDLTLEQLERMERMVVCCRLALQAQQPPS